MDLDGHPIEQADACERLLAERRRLDLADLDRVLGHAEVPSGERGGGWAALDHESRPSLPGYDVGGPSRRAQVRARGFRLLTLDGPIERRER